MVDIAVCTRNISSSNMHAHQQEAIRSSPVKKHTVAGSRKIASRDVPVFLHKMAAMLSSGLSIEAALISVEGQTSNSNFKRVINTVRMDIADGSQLSASFMKFPSIFPPLCTSMIKAAETSGRLAEMLEEIAKYIDANVRLRKKVQSAMIYPAVVLSIAGIVILLFLLFILPVFQSMYQDLHHELPGPTLFLLKASKAIKHHGLWILAGIGLFMVLSNAWKATLTGKVISDWLNLHWPVFGNLTRKTVSARFARAYGQLLRSGIPIINAIELAGAATGNSISEQVVLNARVRVAGGTPLSAALGTQKIFPDTLMQMLQGGEKTGKVDEMMDKTADYFDEEVNMTVDALNSLIQPILIVFLGIIVGGIVIAVLMPLFELPGIIGM